MIASTVGLASSGAFCVRGSESLTIKPFGSLVPPPQPVLEPPYPESTFASAERDLHTLFFLASSEYANAKAKALTWPLRCYQAGRTVEVRGLAPDVLRTAALASVERERQTGTSQTEANWVFQKAKTALVFVAGVEGALAFLRTPEIPLHEREVFARRLFDGVFKLISHQDVRPAEFDVLAEALKEKELAAFRLQLAQPLNR